MVRILLLVSLLLTGRWLAGAEPVFWKQDAVQAPASGYPYLRWTPADGKRPEKGWPLVLWLHGFSLRGNDLAKLKDYGPPAVIDRLEANGVIVAPQLPGSKLVWDSKTLDETLLAILATDKFDRGRIYLAGASLGAGAAYDWMARAPETFAGLVMLAGAGNPAKAETVAKRPVWIFHGTADKQVTLKQARATETGLKAAGGTVKFTELPGIGHDAEALTRAAFIDNKAISWLIAQQGPAAPAGPALPETGKAEVPGNAVIYDWIKGLCATPHRRPGTAEGHQGETWVAARFDDLKLAQVTSDRVPIKVWNPKEWKLTIDGQAAESFFLLNSGFTPAGGITAPLLFGGDGQAGQIKEAKGRIVVVRARAKYHDDSGTAAAFPYNLLGGFLPIKLTDAYERAKKAGAAGFLMLTDDLRSQGNSFYWPYDAEMKSLPALYVGRKDSATVETAAKTGKIATLVQSGTLDEGYMSTVWGVLPGVSDDVLIIASHHDSAHQGAVEDASGIAQVLAQAWTWSRVPREKRPLTLVFVAAAGHFYKGQGAYEWAKAHPELFRRCRAVLTLEHLPAKEMRMGTDGYQSTGRIQPVQIYVSSQPEIAGILKTALAETPPPFTVTVERPFLGFPLSDAAGYLARSKEKAARYPGRDGVPYVSWISAPLYLIDAADTLDKIEKDQLSPLAESITGLVRHLMDSCKHP